MTFFGKCWPWSHNWWEWETIKFETRIVGEDYLATRIVKVRRTCQKCGKIQRRKV